MIYFIMYSMSGSTVNLKRVNITFRILSFILSKKKKKKGFFLLFKTWLQLQIFNLFSLQNAVFLCLLFLFLELKQIEILNSLQRLGDKMIFRNKQIILIFVSIINNFFQVVQWINQNPYSYDDRPNFFLSIWWIWCILLWTNEYLWFDI